MHLTWHFVFFISPAYYVYHTRFQKLGTAGAGPGLSAGPVVATGARPAGAPKSQGVRDPNSKFSDDEVTIHTPTRGYCLSVCTHKTMERERLRDVSPRFSLFPLKTHHVSSRLLSSSPFSISHLWYVYFFNAGGLPCTQCQECSKFVANRKINRLRTCLPPDTLSARVSAICDA